MALCILSPWECRSRNGPQVNGRAFPVSGECAARMISTEKTQSTRPKHRNGRCCKAASFMRKMQSG
ncbi:hypothetical protein MOUN0_C00166 [Monosporozyma unispora]